MQCVSWCDRLDRRIFMLAATVVVLGIAMRPTAGHAADWLTHRGNSARTGNIDNQPGPAAGKILWVHKAADHFIASPVALDQRLFVSGLGAFNTTNFYALQTEPGAKDRVAWSKSAPYLTLPMVSSPAIAGGVLIFGDGMHQTDGAVLHGLRADTGLPLWQYPVPGQLVHLEGSPTIVGNRLLMGGGNAGVFCLDIGRLTLDGQEIDLATVQKTLAQRWKQMLAKYEDEKKTDPDFAIPPSEAALPKPRPKLVWQQGLNQWHVDASVGVTGDRVLVATSFLEEERVGERALLCLSANDGALQWKTPLRFNPWGGPSVAGDLVVVGCSNIRFEAKDIPKGRGEVVAISLADGAVRWRREVPGGVLSPVALHGGLAVFTASDGKVRGWDLSSGEEKWTYDAGQPLFAGSAVAGDAVFAADLKCNVHAIGLADGKRRWTLDVARDPQVQAAGTIFGSPIVHRGRLYVATCNVGGESGRAATAVVCIGDK
jgi:outer membrane protein assembly factor BamB